MTSSVSFVCGRDPVRLGPQCGKPRVQFGAHLILDIENHHNFAWKETHVVAGLERDVIVHRKGATPAGDGVLGKSQVPGGVS